MGLRSTVILTLTGCADKNCIYKLAGQIALKLVGKKSAPTFLHQLGFLEQLVQSDYKFSEEVIKRIFRNVTRLHYFKEALKLC
jgi:hypothetical protein